MGAVNACEHAVDTALFDAVMILLWLQEWLPQLVGQA